MEWIQLWAGITFAAQNGDVEGLLTAAAAGGLHLFDIVPRPGGFSARCAAWHYRKLAALARRRRVRLRIQKRRGLFFCIRPLLRRRGLWAGCLVFLPLLLWLQGFVWFVEPVGLTPGQQARAAVVLWEAGLFPGNAVTQEKLTAGEYALLQSGEFSWASLNFMKGKLVAEAAAAKPVPDIAAGTLPLRDISVDASGNTALLLASGQLCQAVMLGRDLGVENTTQVQASNRIVRSGAQFYLLTDNGVECLSTDGTSQWTQSLSARPQGLLADRRQLLVFCGNTVQGLTPPAAENNAQSNT